MLEVQYSQERAGVLSCFKNCLVHQCFVFFCCFVNVTWGGIPYASRPWLGIRKECFQLTNGIALDVKREWCAGSSSSLPSPLTIGGSGVNSLLWCRTTYCQQEETCPEEAVGGGTPSSVKQRHKFLFTDRSGAFILMRIRLHNNHE